jgi:tetratricopeptide (TPR) repeat protein
MRVLPWLSLCFPALLVANPLSNPLYRAGQTHERTAWAQAQEQYQTEQYREAERTLSELWGSNTDPLLTDDILLMKAECRFHEKDMVTARRLFTQYVLLFPNRVEATQAHGQLARIALTFDQPEIALNECDTALSQHYNPDIALLRIRLLLMLNRAETALTTINELADQHIDDARTAGIGYLNDQLRRGMDSRLPSIEYPESCPQYPFYLRAMAVRDLLSGHPEAALQKADQLAQAELSRYLQQRIAFAKAMNSDQPVSAETQLEAIALAYRNHSDTGKVSEAVIPAIDEQQTMLLALNAEANTRYEQALVRYNQLSTRYPQSIFTWEVSYHKAICLIGLNRLSEAEIRLTDLITSDPLPERVLLARELRADIEARRGNTRMALREYQELLARNDSDKARLLSKMVGIYLEIDDLPEALKLYATIPDTDDSPQRFAKTILRARIARRQVLPSAVYYEQARPWAGEQLSYLESMQRIAQARDNHDASALESSLHEMGSIPDELEKLQLANEYLSLFPDKPFARQAEHIRCTALIRLNRFNEALALLRTHTGATITDDLPLIDLIRSEWSEFPLVSELQGWESRLPDDRLEIRRFMIRAEFDAGHFTRVIDLVRTASTGDAGLSEWEGRARYALNDCPGARIAFSSIPLNTLSAAGLVDYACVLARLGARQEAVQVLDTCPANQRTPLHDTLRAECASEESTTRIPGVVYALLPYDGMTLSMVDAIDSLRIEPDIDSRFRQALAVDARYFSNQPELADRFGLPELLRNAARRTGRLSEYREWIRLRREQ